MKTQKKIVRKIKDENVQKSASMRDIVKVLCEKFDEKSVRLCDCYCEVVGKYTKMSNVVSEQEKLVLFLCL